MSQVGIAAGATRMTEQDWLRLHIVFNNVPYEAGLGAGWGFSCLIAI